jgi:hypothetical protein
MNKSLLLIITAALLFGAGCGSRTQSDITVTPTSSSQTEGAFTQPPDLDPSICDAEETEQENGRRSYPIAPRYAALSHLGELYTLLDCRKRSTAETRLEKQSDGTFRYTQGIRLHWEDTTPSTDAEQVLRILGFTSSSDTTWEANGPFSLDQLLFLRPVFLGPKAPRITEDCIRCG